MFLKFFNHIILENVINFSSILGSLQETIVNVPPPLPLMVTVLLPVEIHTTLNKCLSHQITYLKVKILIPL